MATQLTRQRMIEFLAGDKPNKVRIWNRWMRANNYPRANLRGAYLREADLRGADLSGTDLRGAYLREADLRGADLSEADLSGADLRGADLREAYLSEADLREADLRRADLDNIIVTWTSHDLIAEILHRAAGTDLAKSSLAGLILIQREWCWNEFIRELDDHPLRDWAVDELVKWVKPGDGAPAILRRRAEQNGKAVS